VATPGTPISAEDEQMAEAQSSMIEHFSYEANLAKQYQDDDNEPSNDENDVDNEYGEENEQDQLQEDAEPGLDQQSAAPGVGVEPQQMAMHAPGVEMGAHEQ